MHEAHLLWACPLAIIVVSSLLIVVMGVTTILGIVILALMLPIIKMVTSWMAIVREKRMRFTDERINVVSAMLQGIKVTKLNHYESKFEERVAQARGREITYMKKEQAIWACTMFMTMLGPVMATTATFFVFVLVDENNILTATQTFTTLLLFQALRFPIAYAGKLVGKAALGYQACLRISQFFKREVRTAGTYSEIINEVSFNASDELDETQLLKIKGATFYIGSALDPIENSKAPSQDFRLEETDAMVAHNHHFSLSNINLTLSQGEVMAVVGEVASGKSTLLNGIIGEVPASEASVIKSKTGLTISYASQNPFIMNATVRENILFGKSFERERYEKVLDACCLGPDLAQIGSSGDLTQIGERGVTLSGGQKQRVSLARAVYANSDITIFDDPLSALDSGTLQKVFENLFTKKTDLLSTSAVILVTHAAHFLNRVDRLMVLHEGKSIFYGTWKDLLLTEQTESEYHHVLSTLCSISQNDSEEMSFSTDDSIGQKIFPCTGNTQDRKQVSHEMKEEIITVETREHGLSSIRTWLLWFLNAGGWWFVFLQFFFLVLDRGSYVAIEWWIALWTGAVSKPVNVFGHVFPPQTDGLSAQVQYLGVYSFLFIIMVIFCVLRSEWAVAGGSRCAERMFSRITHQVLRSPMSFFDTTPIGRLLNRFTYDVEIVDVNLTQAMALLMVSISWLVAGQILMTMIIPWLLLVNLFVMVLYAIILLYFRRSAADLQRLDAVSRSPIQALLSEGLDGATTIRVFQKESFFLSKFLQSLNTNSSAMMNFIAAQNWLAVRIECLGAFVTLAACLFVTTMNEQLGLAPGFVGLLVIWTSNFTITLGFLMNAISEAEASITSIERLHSMELLPSEADLETTKDNQVDLSWPQHGLLEFRNVKMRYRDGLPLALNELSFTVRPKQRCGVVGRTGAGKTSITTALYRLAEIESGTILLDGVDLAKIGLDDVRGRSHGMYILPQDPVLFAGTLRSCLDPFGSSSDEIIFDALQSVRFPGIIKHISLLEEKVDEGGANYSVGERQLICMARALLAKPKLLIMDEATASIDGKTDEFIQEMLRQRFQETTILTIAHRLDTIIDYDVILVMDKGKAAEFGTPNDLLKHKDSIFTQMVNATGKANAALLKEITFRN